jgi:hypothetical protein
VHSTLKSRLEWCELGYSENLLRLGDFSLTEPKSVTSAAESSAVTAPTVVAGLGYPAERKETSPEPTGWRVNVSDVSRETSAKSIIQDSDSASEDHAGSSRETFAKAKRPSLTQPVESETRHAQGSRETSAVIADKQ